MPRSHARDRSDVGDRNARNLGDGDRLRWPNGMELHGFGHYRGLRERWLGWRIKTSLLTACAWT